MIPKKLHYIWLGGEKTPLTQKCVESFNKYLYDYEVVEWNESNIEYDKYTECLKKYYEKWYSQGMFAFCSDIARLYILSSNGGLYADADVEFIKHMPDRFIEKPLIARSSYNNGTVCNGCVWGCNKDDRLVLALTRWFDNHLQIAGDLYGKTWVFNSILMRFFELFGDNVGSNSIDDFHGYNVFPVDYFCAKNRYTGELSITNNTISICHFAGSWH